MKNPSLREIANYTVLQNLMRQTLEEMLQIKDKYTVVPFGYRGWEIETYLSNVSSNIAKAMYDTGQKIGNSKFKSFSDTKTKLNKEILEEMWHEASKVIAQEIYKGYEEGETNTIPGLKEAVEKGAIMRSRDPHSAEKEEMDLARSEISTRAEKMDYRDDFIRRFREKFFQHMRTEFDIFSEPAEEIAREFKPKIH